MKKIYILFLVSCILLGVLGACTSQDDTVPRENTEKISKEKLTIAYQYGIAYAPYQIMQEKKLIEKYLPDIEVDWKIMNSGQAMNEGIISGDIDVAVMGVPPFLIGWDKGVPYKIYSAVIQQPLGLITYDESISSLSDFKLGDKIAVPSIGSIQHIMLSMASEKYLGDSKAMDPFVVNMSTPDGMQALLSKTEVKGHITTPPYYNLELENKGFRLVFSGDEVFGEPYTSIVGVASNKLFTEHKDVYEALYNATNDAMKYIQENPEETATLLSEKEGIAQDKMLSYIIADNINYGTESVGVIKMAEFMNKEGYISKIPNALEEIIHE